MPATIITQSTRRFIAGYVPAASSGFDVLDALFDLLISAGWTAIDHSDGGTVNAGRRTIGAWTVNEWQRLRAPSGTSEVVFQAGTTGGNSWKGYFAEGGYNTGTATVLPTPVTALDNLQIIGTGNAFDTTWTGSTPENIRWFGMADTVSLANGGGNEIFRFYLFARSVGSGNAHRQLFVWTLNDVRAGTYGVADRSPYVVRKDSQLVTATMSTSYQFQGYFRKGQVDAAIGNALSPVSYGGFPDSGNVDPYESRQLLSPIILNQTTTPIQMKGTLKDVFWASQGGSTGDTYNLADDFVATPPGALIRFDSMLWPWPTGQAVVI